MKIIALHSSARQNGNTSLLVRLVEERLRGLAEAAGVPLDFEAVALAGADIALCRGCRVCFDRGEEKCPLKDGLSELYRKLLEADGVILASPVYVEDVNGFMKSFIDRMAFNCHRPGFAGKTALVLVTSGSGATKHAVRTMTFALGSWGFHTAGSGRFRMGALMDESAAREKYGASAGKLAEKLFRAVRDKRAEKPSFYSLMIFKVQQTIYRTSPIFEGTYDRSWWEAGGKLDQKRTFYIEHRANPVKVFFARGVGAVLAKVFG